MNIRVFGFVCIPATLIFSATGAFADNQQTVSVRNGIVNSATTGSTAVMNIASTKGIPVPGGNRQVAQINGPVLNAAGAGGHAELNIASKTPAGSSGSQVISINGPVVNQAFGRTSIMNIGSSR